MLALALWAWLTAVFVRSAGTGLRPVNAAVEYKTFYFQQPLDHFSFAVKGNFRQRYLVNDAYWKGSGSPIFFYTGNEGDIVWFYNNTGLMLEWAPDFDALLVFAEHRYYGESLPFGKDSFKGLEHVGYLSSEQALADFATLIDHIKRSMPGASDSPVVAFGGSYGGMLAAWLRMKYPHSVIGSLAASAPIWLFDDLVPCNLFSQIITHDFNRSSENCAANIRRSWTVIDGMAVTESGRATLTSILKLCEPVSSIDDVRKLKDWLSETWTNLAMVDYPYPANFLEPLPAWPVKVVCSHLVEADLTDIELIQHLHDALSVYYNYTQSVSCFDTNHSAVSSLETVGWGFQSCTEMVMPSCSDGTTDMFEPAAWNLSRFVSDCRKTWNVVPRPRWVVEQYGGKNISAASNIIFSNGDLDPWSAGGVLQSPAPSLVAIVIKDGAHHLDLRSSNPSDTAAVIATRKKEKTVVRRWLRQYRGLTPTTTTEPVKGDATEKSNIQVVVLSPMNGNNDAAGPSYGSRGRVPTLRDEILVFVVMVAMFVGLLVIVGVTRNTSRRRLLSLDDMPLM